MRNSSKMNRLNPSIEERTDPLRKNGSQVDPEPEELDDDRESYNGEFEEQEDYEHVTYEDRVDCRADLNSERCLIGGERAICDAAVLAFHQTPRGRLLSKRDYGVPIITLAPLHKQLLRRLCQDTGSLFLEPRLLQILPDVVRAACNLELYRIMSSGRSCHSVIALIVYVWLTLCSVHPFSAWPVPKTLPITLQSGSR